MQKKKKKKKSWIPIPSHTVVDNTGTSPAVWKITCRAVGIGSYFCASILYQAMYYHSLFPMKASCSYTHIPACCWQVYWTSSYGFLGVGPSGSVLCIDLHITGFSTKWVHVHVWTSGGHACRPALLLHNHGLQFSQISQILTQSMYSHSAAQYINNQYIKPKVLKIEHTAY